MACDDHALAGDLATQAGRLLLTLRRERFAAMTAESDPGGPDVLKRLRDDGDRASHEWLIAELARLRPGDAVLSEEGKDDPARLTADRVWIVDPLDGTREFAEKGRSDWAVHVALWGRSGHLAGAVALPAQQLTLCTSDTGAVAVSTADGRPAAPLHLRDGTGSTGSTEPTGPLRVAVSRTRPPEFVQRLAAHLGEVRLVPIGSAGAKIAAVLLSQVDAYVHAGGQYEWDSAAPAAVALAAGAHASRIDGAALVYNQKDPKLPDILVCHSAWAPTLLAGIQDVAGPEAGGDVRRRRNDAQTRHDQ